MYQRLYIFRLQQPENNFCLMLFIESDVDLTAIIEQKFTNIVDDLFYDEFMEYLKGNDSLSIDDYRVFWWWIYVGKNKSRTNFFQVIKKSRVPIIKLFIGGIEVNCLLCFPCFLLK